METVLLILARGWPGLFLLACTVLAVIIAFSAVFMGLEKGIERLYRRLDKPRKERREGEGFYRLARLIDWLNGR